MNPDGTCLQRGECSCPAHLTEQVRQHAPHLLHLPGGPETSSSLASKASAHSGATVKDRAAPLSLDGAGLVQATPARPVPSAVSRGGAGLGEARLGAALARQALAGRGLAGLGKARRTFIETWRGTARLGRAWRGWTWHGAPRQGKEILT